MKEIKDILTALDENDRAVLATVIDVEGSAYRRAGARMLIHENGDNVGTVSGGCLEADVMERAKRVLKSGEAELFTYDTTDDEDSVFSMNMGCRGVIKISLEAVDRDTEIVREMRNAYEHRVATVNFTPPIAVQLFGAGADAIPFVRFAAELGWQVTVHDHRGAFLTSDRFPTARELVKDDRDEAPKLSSDDRTAAVVMTHNYERDSLIYPALFSSKVFYIGALGPKRRMQKLIDELGLKTDHRLHSPVGLDIGAETPEAIALAIIAEIQSVAAGRDGASLRDREGSIYDR